MAIERGFCGGAARRRQVDKSPLGGAALRGCSDQASATNVLVIGPPSTTLGGMASVVAQTLSLDFAGRYQAQGFPITISPGASERFTHRVTRHVRRLGLLRSAIRSGGTRIVHIHTCSGFSFYRSALDATIARRMGCRVLLHVHGAAFDSFHARATPAGQWLIARSLQQADRVVALSEGWRGKLLGMAPAARVVVIENAIEVPSIATARQNGLACRFVLLARMDVWKGVDDLLDACAMLHLDGTAFELVLAGPPGTAGDETILGEKIRERRLADVVRYVGPVYGEGKSNLLSHANVYVQPSHHEGMPISMLEALAHGLPVIATKVGAVPEVIEDRRHGLLVAPHEPAQLARAMGTLASDRKRLASLSREAHALIAERFSLERFRDDLLALYDATCSGLAGGQPGAGDRR